MNHNVCLNHGRDDVPLFRQDGPGALSLEKKHPVLFCHFTEGPAHVWIRLRDGHVRDLDVEVGVYLQQTTPGQGAAIIRGLKGSQVLHLIDGMRLNNAFFRNAPNQYLGLVDAYNTERTEVVRGAAPSLYGADAMGGVLQVLSPEQARGKPVDRRADIWAFGCVLYEMLTGRPAFPGETLSDTLAAILARDPAPSLTWIDSLPPGGEATVLLAAAALAALAFQAAVDNLTTAPAVVSLGAVLLGTAVAVEGPPPGPVNGSRCPAPAGPPARRWRGFCHGSPNRPGGRGSAGARFSRSPSCPPR